MWFNEDNYKEKLYIKWNPAIKKESDRSVLFEALLNDKLDVVATDHAPHTIEEKSNTYLQNSLRRSFSSTCLVNMLEFYKKGKISLEKIVEKMCHNPAILFQIVERGYIKEGYYVDLVLVDLDQTWQVNKDNILYKCNWSPFLGYTFSTKVSHTFINGNLV